MKEALLKAQEAVGLNEVPIGALLVCDGKILSLHHNLCESLNNPLAHAEFLVVQEALQFTGRYDLGNCDLYVTLEPCSLCASILERVRIRRLIFGAYDPKGGGVDHNARIFQYGFHKPEVIGGILEKECGSLLRSFFQEKVRKKPIDLGF
jgi:tRNA(Arg) A34 adenosine deaminase TadA